MPDTQPFADGIQFLHEHIINLKRHWAEERDPNIPATRQTLLDIAFETMNGTIEELRVAEEEMRAQNEALAAAHDTVETWRRHYEDLFESAPDAYLVTDLHGVVTEANRVAAQRLGISQPHLKGKPFATFIPDSDRPAFHDLLREAPKAPATLDRELRVKPRRDPPLEVTLSLSAVRDPQGRPTGLRWLMRDMTSRNQAETDRYRMLVEEVKDYAVILMDPEGLVFTWNGGAERIFGNAEAEMRGQPMDCFFTPEDRDAGIPAQERRQAQAEGRAEDERWHLRKDGRRFWASGILTALRDRTGRLRWYAKILRDMTAHKEEEQRREEACTRERQIAETFQRALLPLISPDAFPRLSLAALYEAAWKEAQVGGDFYDAFALDDGRVALVVGDVSGKGLPAAAHMAEIKGALRAFLRETPDVGSALSRMNTFVYDNQRLPALTLPSPSPSGGREAALDPPYVTLTVLLIIPETGEAIVGAAGAEPPLLLRQDGTAAPIAAAGHLLGIGRKAVYPLVHLTLTPGDTIILATDGITEARRGQAFLDYDGMVRLAQEVRRDASPHEIGRAILEGARAFAGGALSDDACLLLVRRI